MNEEQRNDLIYELVVEGHLLQTTDGFMLSKEVTSQLITLISKYPIDRARKINRTVKADREKVTRLAEKLRELYPKGIRSGHYFVRSPLSDVVHKLTKYLQELSLIHI